MRNVLVGALLASAAFGGCRGWDSEQPPIHLVHNMDTQEKGKAYRRDTSGLFADGRVMRAPPEGTVAQGQLDEDDSFFKGIDDKGEPSKAFPTSLKEGETIPDALADRGKGRYAIYCTPCHGPNGEGKGVVVQRGYEVPAPAFTDDRLKEMVVGKIFSAMTNGVNNGNMPSYASQIPVKDRWAIAAFIRRDIQKVPYENAGAVVVMAEGISADNGSKLYKVKGCNACHSIDGSKIVGPSFKGLWGRSESCNTGEHMVDETYVTESIRNPMAKVVTGFAPAMPPQTVAMLSDDELKSIIEFLKTLK